MAKLISSSIVIVFTLCLCFGFIFIAQVSSAELYTQDVFIRTFHGKQCISSVQNTRTIISDCTKRKEDNTHLWSYYDYKQETPTSFFVQLQSKRTGKCLSIINGVVGLYTCTKGFPGQVWHLQYAQHIVRILDPTTKKCLSVQANGYEQVFGNGSPLVMEECDARKNKMFLLENKVPPKGVTSTRRSTSTRPITKIV